MAQSFNSLKKAPTAAFNATLAKLLDDCDTGGMESYLQQNPQAANDASQVEQRDGLSEKKITTSVPLLHDAVCRALDGRCTATMCGTVIRAGCNLIQPSGGKTPIYIVLDFIAAHPKHECATAEEVLSLILSRQDFDINLRYQSLLPPFAYLIRENHTHLGKFSKDYISDNVLRLLIEKGAPVNTYDGEGNSLMAFAMDTENEYLQSYFIQQGIDVKKSDRNGRDAIYRAIAEGRLPLLKQMLSTPGTDFDIHSLKNDPATFRQFEDTYDFLTERFAGQVTSYEDIRLFLSKFADRSTLVQPKLYAIYKKEYTVLVEKHRQEFIAIGRGTADAEQVGRRISSDQSIPKDIATFIDRHSMYDPDSHVTMAQEMKDVYDVCTGLSLNIPSTYIFHLLKAEKNPLIALIGLAYYAGQGNYDPLDIRTGEHEAHERTLTQAWQKSSALEKGNAFHLGTFFDSACRVLESKDSRLREVWDKDVTTWNVYAQRTNAEAEKSRIAHRQYLCERCEIDEEKTRFPEDVKKEILFMEYTEQNPGKLVTKNGEKQEFYWDAAKKCWYTESGFIFIDREMFKTLDELIAAFLKRCKEKYCG
jgi:hypothetical protein